MGLRGLVALGFYAGLVCAGWAWSPPPPGAERTVRVVTHDEMWNGADVVAYGRVVRLERKESLPNDVDYEVGIKVERVWKGEVIGDIVMVEMLPPYGSGVGFRFEFDQTYLLFAGRAKGAGAGEYFRNHAIAVELPRKEARNTLSSIFGMPAEPDLSEVLAVFLEAKSGDSAAAPRYELLWRRWEESRRVKQRAAEVALEKAREKEREEREAPLTEAKAELKDALKEMGVAERRGLLEALDKKLAGKYAPEFKELKEVVAKERSLAETYFKNGLTRFD